jgi:MEMO1 family protein
MINKKLFVFIVLIIFVWFLPNFFKENNSKTKVSLATHPNLFYDESLFYNGIANIEEQAEVNKKIKGGIIPHHLLPSHLVLDFFSRLSLDTDTIILLGPNHYELGDHNIITSQYAWDTVFGSVEPNFDISNQLINNPQLDIAIDEEVALNEHSVSGIMPYIKYYLPDTRVVPLILSTKNTIDDSKKLASYLNQYSEENKIVIVASVDFSHYLRQEETRLMDEQSRIAIEQHDYDTIQGFSNDNLDSPPAIITILKYMEGLGAEQEIIANTNSGVLLDIDSEDLTSYFEILFIKK